MKKSFIIPIFLVLVLLVSSLLVACGPKQFPKECYRKDVVALYMCEQGEKVLQYGSTTDYTVIDFDGNEIMCSSSDKDSEPCDILQSDDYCPKINYCSVEE